MIYFGIDSRDPAVQAQIEALRDSGRIVHLYGTLLATCLTTTARRSWWIASRSKGRRSIELAIGMV